MIDWVIAALTVASTYQGYQGQRAMGKAQEAEFRRQAEEERIAAQAEELTRAQERNRLLAASTEALARSGIAAEGTPASIALSSAENISLSEGMIKLSDRLKRDQLRRQGTMARKTANIQAQSTLLKGATQLASNPAFQKE
jgi:hypothetical protein